MHDTVTTTVDDEPREELPWTAIGTVIDIEHYLGLRETRLRQAVIRGYITPVYRICGRPYIRLVDAVLYCKRTERKGYRYVQKSTIGQ